MIRKFVNTRCITTYNRLSKQASLRSISSHRYLPVEAQTSKNHFVTKNANLVYGWKTINEGERAIVWDSTGKMEFVQGPQRQFLFGSTVQLLNLYTADPTEYIVVNYKDGKKEYLYGPISLWENPMIYESVTVEQATTINANEAVVVYNETGGTIERKVVVGPKIHMPVNNEWMHTFQWTGADPLDHSKKKSGALRFNKLRLIRDQMYYDVSIQ
jgi:hypothetical protein